MQNCWRVYGSNDFLKPTSYKKSDCDSYSLYAFEMFKSVANTISKLMSRVISEIIITPIRLLIVHCLFNLSFCLIFHCVRL